MPTAASKLPPTVACPRGPVARPPAPPAIPTGTAASSLAPRVYAVNNKIPPSAVPGTPYVVDVIDPVSNQITKAIPVLPKPHHVYVVPGQDEAYISQFVGCRVTVVNLLTNTVIGYVRSLYGPRHMAFGPNGRLAYIVDYYDKHLTVVDTRTNRTVAEVPTGRYPNYPVITSQGRLVFVANLGSGTATVISGHAPFKVLKTVRVGPKPFSAAPSRDGRLMLVANAGNNTVSFIDTRTLAVVATVPFRKARHASDRNVSQKANIRVSANGRYAWVGDQAGADFGVIDIRRRRLVAEIPAGSGADILFQPGGGPARGLGITTARYANFADVVRPNHPILVTRLFTAPQCRVNPACPTSSTGKTGPAGSGSHVVTFNRAWTTGYISDRPGSAVTVVDLSSGRPVFVTNIRTTYAPYGFADGIAYVWFSNGKAQSHRG